MIIFFILLFQIILILAIALVSVIAFYLMLSSRFMCNAPPIPSTGKVKVAMLEDVAKVLKRRKTQVVMDLGSGWGTLLLPLAKKFPQHHFVGIEYAFIPYFVSKFRSRGMKNIVFYRQNFFNADISEANIIFLFLLNHVISKMSIKCQKETKKGTLFYVNRFPMKNVKLKKEISLGSKYDTYYIYENSDNV